MPAHTDEVQAVHRHLQPLRGSAFHGTPGHRASSIRLQRRVTELLREDPAGPHADSLHCALELLEGLCSCDRRRAC